MLLLPLRCCTPGSKLAGALSRACSCALLLHQPSCSTGEQRRRQQQYPASAAAVLASHHQQLLLLLQPQAAAYSSQAAAPHSRSSSQPHKGRHRPGSRSQLQTPPEPQHHHQQQQQQQQQQTPAAQTQLQAQLQRLQQQQKQHGAASELSGSSSIIQPQLPTIPEGQLTALIAAAHSISDVEAVVLQYHSQFKYHHIAAAVQKLPTLDMEASLNRRQRFSHLVSLLASGLSNVSRLLDAHQAAGCLAALTSPRCLPPMRHGPLLRLLLLLLEEDAARLRQLHSYELAQCAAAAAAMQDAMQQPQQQWGPTAAAAAAADKDSFTPPSSQQLQLQQQTGPQSSFNTALSPTEQDSSSSSGALALQHPLQRLWQALRSVITPQLSTFSADSLALTALSFAAAEQARELMLAVTHAALARPHKFAESPVAAGRLLKACVLSDFKHEDLLAVLASAVAATATSSSSYSPDSSSSYSLQQLADAAAALAHFSFYHEPALEAVCRAATRSLRQGASQSEDVASLLSLLEALRFRHEPLFKAAVKALTAAAAAAAVTAAGSGQQHQQIALCGEQLAASLAALLQLGFSGQALEGLLQATLRLVASTQDDASSSSSSLSPAGTIKLLWAAAVLEEPAASILPLLLGGLEGAAADAQSQRDLRLLHQAHRLLDSSWVLAADSSSSSSSSSSSGEQALLWQRHAGLLKAAREAAAVHAAASASRGKQQMQAVQDAFEGLGYDAPVRGFKIDGGALRPDLALVVPEGGGEAAMMIKVALMCDHSGRFSRSLPHELLGYWRVAERLLQADGWRVVRFPAHEWRVLMADRGAREGSSQLSHVFNTLAAQGVPLG